MFSFGASACRFYCPGEAGVCGNEVAGESLMSQSQSILVYHVYVKPAGVPDKLFIFPADES